MSNNNNYINELLGKMDEKMLKVKLNSAIETLKKSNIQDLEKKIGKIDKDKLMNDIDQVLKKKPDLKSSSDFGEMKNKITSQDLTKLSQALGNNNPDLMKKLKGILK